MATKPIFVCVFFIISITKRCQSLLHPSQVDKFANISTAVPCLSLHWHAFVRPTTFTATPKLPLGCIYVTDSLSLGTNAKTTKSTPNILVVFMA